MGLGRILGFGRGKIRIILDKFQFVSGETITGKIVLTLKKPLKAKELNITLIGEQKVTERSGGEIHTRTIRIFDFTQPLDGEKEYPPSTMEYKFSLLIPKDVGKNTAPEGTLGNVMKVMRAFSSTSRTIKWSVVARLDIPWAIDMTKKVRINIQ